MSVRSVAHFEWAESAHEEQGFDLSWLEAAFSVHPNLKFGILFLFLVRRWNIFETARLVVIGHPSVLP